MLRIETRQKSRVRNLPWIDGANVELKRLRREELVVRIRKVVEGVGRAQIIPGWALFSISA
ncbi:hypothetical protein HYALB_00012240 [Hymenoscyphus albidus]|uniref:Uncharacterized protein n=1 Tax=Hymenoscyphus albidus TaxID=595503 RepID=A0A9N9Q0Z2_9HELO|nr:hypothetical protein HYALB_00012240 [Hymenoscyphus albidus]